MLVEGTANDDVLQHLVVGKNTVKHLSSLCALINFATAEDLVIRHTKLCGLIFHQLLGVDRQVILIENSVHNILLISSVFLEIYLRI